MGTEAEQALRRAHAELERLLGERNAELDGTNQLLRDKVAECDAANERAQALSLRLLEAEEDERGALSRELHDRAGQTLAALGINLDFLRTHLSRNGGPELRSRVEDSIALVASTADAIENLMSELRPPMLKDHGLLAALQWYAKEFSKRTGIHVRVRAERSQCRPGRDIEITLFRIAQEALNNVAKHARAARVEIELEQLGSICRLSVSDDGIGVDRAAAVESTLRRGFGIMTMRERAQAIGAQFELQTVPGGGTRIAIQIAG